MSGPGLEGEITSVGIMVARMQTDQDRWFLVLCGFGILFMHAGFAMLSVGSVRGKNAKEILMKVLLDASFASLGWWATGYALAFGRGNGFCGGRGFFFSGFSSTQYTEYFFQYAFAATAATIVSGSVAERTKMAGYACYSFFLSMWTYPIVAHWMWSSTGWLGALRASAGTRLFGTGAIDYAGCGVIHMLGGLAGLVGAWAEGPRLGRFTADGRVVDMPGHNTSLIILGDFILWFGWYFFNCGSTGGLTGRSIYVARAAVMTTLAATSGAISTLLLSYAIQRARRGRQVFDIIHTSQGLLAGLISITASCGLVEGWAAVIIGAIGGGVYLFSAWLVLNVFKVDDPLEASALHGGCGLWGLIAVGFFASRTPATDLYGHGTDWGVIMGGRGTLLGAQLISAIVIIGWTLGNCVPFFLLLNRIGWLRVPANVEIDGLDLSHHGGGAYDFSHAGSGHPKAMITGGMGGGNLQGSEKHYRDPETISAYQDAALAKCISEIAALKKEVFLLKSKGL